jgi:hypothetical protein
MPGVFTGELGHYRKILYDSTTPSWVTYLNDLTRLKSAICCSAEFTLASAITSAKFALFEANRYPGALFPEFPEDKSGI